MICLLNTGLGNMFLNGAIRLNKILGRVKLEKHALSGLEDMDIEVYTSIRSYLTSK